MAELFGDLMLCQNCGAVHPFDADGHNEEYYCDCGGQWCGCSDCSRDAHYIQHHGLDAFRVRDSSVS